MFGPDAVGYNPSANSSDGSDFAIKQAYITLRTPVGNGIDWKIGVFDTIIGYEVTDAANDPNYTRSYGYAVEPTEHTGVLGTYKINDQWSVSAGLANTLNAGINARDNESGFGNGNGSDWKKTLMASVTYTAPSSWGWAAGSSLYAGTVYGYAGNAGGSGNGYQMNVYAGATLNTPWKQLTGGIAFDYVHNLGGGDNFRDVEEFGIGSYNYRANAYVIGLYATYKATPKLSLNARGEWIHTDVRGGYNYSYTGGEGAISSSYNTSADACELTLTAEYDMWANVMSRLEVRWDHVLKDPNNVNPLSPGGDELGGDFHRTSVGLYANVIYKF
jgi:hypothetical protein